MTPQPRGVVPPATARRLKRAAESKRAADLELRAAVVAALRAGGSVREVAVLTQLSTNTVQRWAAGVRP